jgi:phage-related protein
MNTLTIDILNPKVEKLLLDLVDLELISIRDEESNAFLKTLNFIRNKSELNEELTLDEITAEVEEVRSKRYED